MYQQYLSDDIIFLPITENAFDELVLELVSRFNLPNVDHAAAVVANAIMHLSPEVATTTLKYLGHYVLHNVAWQIAKIKGQQASHKTQVDALIALLMTEPNNQQARDALEKAVNDGSTYAKEELGKLQPRGSGDVIELFKQPPTGEDTATAMVPTVEPA